MNCNCHCHFECTNTSTYRCQKASSSCVHCSPTKSDTETEFGIKSEKQYPCIDCGKLRTKSEGGTTFSKCDDCFSKSEKSEWEERFNRAYASDVSFQNLCMMTDFIREEKKKSALEALERVEEYATNHIISPVFIENLKSEYEKEERTP